MASVRRLRLSTIEDLQRLGVQNLIRAELERGQGFGPAAGNTVIDRQGHLREEEVAVIFEAVNVPHH
jgi:hypothetical protein